MAKPIKKNRARFSSGINFKQVGGFFLGVLFFVAIFWGIYWFYHHDSTTKTSTDHSVSTLTHFISQNGLKTSGVLILAIGGMLFAFIFNKK